MMGILSALKLSLGLGLSGLVPFSSDLSQHVNYLDSFHETRMWEGDIKAPSPLVPQGGLWARFGPVRASFSFAGNRAQGSYAGTSTVEYSFFQKELSGRIQFLADLGPIHLFAGPQMAYSTMGYENSGDYRSDTASFSGWGMGGQAGAGLLLPLGKLNLGAELFASYQPTSLEGIWFDVEQGVVYQSDAPREGDRQARFSTTGIGLRLLVGFGF